MIKFCTAASVSAAVILSAPFVGQIRAALRTAFPSQFVTIVAVAVAAAIGIAVLIAFARIRDRRRLRFAAIAGALALGAGYMAALGTGIPEIDAVERVHFIEYGLVTFLFYRAWRPIGDVSLLVLPVLAGLIVGTVEEWFQWFIPVRVGEARDVLLNLAAIVSGLLFSIGVDPPQTFTGRLHQGSASRLGLAAATALLVFAVFVHTVHLGYEIVDEEIGSFKSRYRPGELEALARDRAARWRLEPPVVLRRLSREDQYMDEGLWHVRRRNEAWTAGDYVTAWKENRILEKFFAPVLDTPSYVSASGHRWPPGQRAEGATRGTGSAASYVSDATPRPILTWPKPLFWIVTTVVTMLIALRCVLIDRRTKPRLQSRAAV